MKKLQLVSKTKIKSKPQKVFKEFKNKDGKHFKVAIFGSSKIEEGDIAYERIRHLAEMLGAQGIDILTGGGPGLMKAANEGHVQGTNKANTHAHSVGIGVRLPWNQEFNDAVEYKEKMSRFSKRLDEFMLMSNAVVVAPGGLGTMLELFYTWQLVQVHHICDIPIILMGEQWGGLLKWIKNEPLKTGYLEERDYKLVFHAKNSKQAVEIIDEAYEHFKKGGKNFCLNYEMYRSK
ncbi:MAG: LOG family protein [bacterium]|nr:LOG family protein [bacterium]